LCAADPLVRGGGGEGVDDGVLRGSEDILDASIVEDDGGLVNYGVRDVMLWTKMPSVREKDSDSVLSLSSNHIYLYSSSRPKLPHWMQHSNFFSMNHRFSDMQ